MVELYPEIEPYQTGRLKVSDLHELYYEQIGNPQGKPVIFLHGGPGSGCNPRWRTFFNPKQYRLVLLDQRGSGKSTPHAELKENTTPLLVDDIEKLREHLGIKKWLVFGGSWGSTLALAYAQAHPECVTEMIMYGIFLGSREECDWVYKKGASIIFPDFWEKFVLAIEPNERHDLISAYYRIFTKGSRAEQIKAAKAWGAWEGKLTTLDFDETTMDTFTDDEFAMAHSRLECHYFINDCFLKPGQLLAGVEKIKHIPAIIVQGRYDMVCPIETAWKLHRAWPKSKLIIPIAGHSSRDMPNQLALLEAIGNFA